MIRKNAVKGHGKPFTIAEAAPGKARKVFGSQKDVEAARNMDTGGDDAMNIIPSFQEVARSKAAKD